MERVWTGDLESDGLLDTATRVWCGVFKNFHTEEIKQFYPGSHESPIQAMLKFLDEGVDVLSMHGGTGFDWPLLEKLHDYKYRRIKVDTLLVSRLQRPNRRSPPTCPNKNAPHSVEAWGYRVGRGKPEHNDWSVFSRDMLHRCTEDVEIQHLILKALIEEGKGQDWRDAHMMTGKLFERLQKQEQYGWLVDQDHMHFCVKMLTKWIERIDRVIIPYLPMIVEIEETRFPPAEREEKGEYRYVQKPFKKNGEYTSHVNKWLDAEEPKAGLGYKVCHNNVAGPFSRVVFRRTDLNSNAEVKNFLLSEGWEPNEWN